MSDFCLSVYRDIKADLKRHSWRDLWLLSLYAECRLIFEAVVYGCWDFHTGYFAHSWRPWAFQAGLWLFIALFDFCRRATYKKWKTHVKDTDCSL